MTLYSENSLLSQFQTFDKHLYRQDLLRYRRYHPPVHQMHPPWLQILPYRLNHSWKICMHPFHFEHKPFLPKRQQQALIMIIFSYFNIFYLTDEICMFKLFRNETYTFQSILNVLFSYIFHKKLFQ